MNPNFSDRYSVLITEVETNGRESTLIVKGIQPSDAGKYHCQEVGGSKYNHSFILVVLRKIFVNQRVHLK